MPAWDNCQGIFTGVAMLTEEEKVLAQSADYFKDTTAYGYVDHDGRLHL